MAKQELSCPCEETLILPQARPAGGHVTEGVLEVVLHYERCNREAVAETYYPSEKQE